MRPASFAKVVALLLGILVSPSSGSGETPKPVIFAVSDVPLAAEPLPSTPALEILSHPAGDKMEAFSPVGNQAWVALPREIRHPFVAAAHLAFRDHRPLALNPDMIWLLLVQMAAAEVQARPEEHRRWFASHQHGKRALIVRNDHLMPGDMSNDWPSVFADFERQILRNAPGSPIGDFSHKFSTSTAAEIASRRVVLLSASSPYYNLRLHTLSGIPHIELHGSADDWRWIRGQAEALARFDMERRITALAPVLDEFVAAAEGKANPAFWRSFYRYADESGFEYVSGWINLFFVRENSPSLHDVLNPGFSWACPPETREELGAVNLPLASGTGFYPTTGCSEVEFTWEYLGEDMPMRLRAGFMGIAQDDASKTLRPAIAWQVVHEKVTTEERKVLDFLGTLGKLGGFEVEGVRQDFILDPETGKIRMKREGERGRLDGLFWSKAFPMMRQLHSVDISSVLRVSDSEEGKAICSALLSAPRVSVVLVPRGLDEECLRILQGRDNWQLKTRD